MRKFLNISICCMLFVLIFSKNVSAKDINIFIDGKKLECEVKPYISNGRTLVPVRAIAEAFDFDVNYYPETEDECFGVDLTSKETGRVIHCDEGSVISDGIFFIEPESNDNCVTIKKSRMFISIRYLANAMHLKVDWDGKTKTINLSTDETVTKHPISCLVYNGGGNKDFVVNTNRYVEYRNGRYLLNGTNETLEDFVEVMSGVQIDGPYSEMQLYGNNLFFMKLDRSSISGATGG